jgi:hypothetical protein
MYLQKVIRRKTVFFKLVFFVAFLKVNDKNSRIQIRIRIHQSEAWSADTDPDPDP